MNTSCKKEETISQIKDLKQLKNNKLSETKDELDCGDVVYQIVKSSNLNLKDYNNNYFVRLEKIIGDSINIKVYVENNLSDDPKQEEIVESTIARLLFLPNKEKLWNITADPEHPTEVKYKYKDFASIYKLCGISKKASIDDSKLINTNNIDCKTITVEMGKGEECTLKNTNINDVYDNIINNQEVDDCKYLLQSIPKSNKVIIINKDGLINIEYKIKIDRLEITFYYDGGITSINIEKLNNESVKRSIIYYAN
ncbi:hypothetical protein [Flavobacterium ginsengiterrae]|uniref:Uncharacterized protein n=1 Tax=Flavobacterium ginsengiterrae TaxID=871695 RepID=A0ABP7G8S6_9FLAO